MGVVKVVRLRRGIVPLVEMYALTPLESCRRFGLAGIKNALCVREGDVTILGVRGKGGYIHALSEYLYGVYPASVFSHRRGAVFTGVAFHSGCGAVFTIGWARRMLGGGRLVFFFPAGRCDDEKLCRALRALSRRFSVERFLVAGHYTLPSCLEGECFEEEVYGEGGRTSFELCMGVLS